MKINNQELILEELVKELNPREKISVKDNPFYLNNTQVQVLKNYGFILKKYSNVKSLIFDIENYLQDNYEYDNEELELVADSLKEYDYYANTNK